MIFVLVAGATAMLITLLGTPLLIRMLRSRGYEQAIRTSTETVNYPEHGAKKGTPSMGGAAIIVAVVVAYSVAHLADQRGPTPSGILSIYLIVGLGVVGFIDDYFKIFKRRSTGMRARAKLAGQAAVAISFAWLSTMFPNEYGITPASTAISFIRDLPIVLPLGVFLIWIWFLITATTNAVNLTDGLDGLATGAAVMTFVAYILMSVWQFGQACSFGVFERCYDARDPLDMAVVAAACAGACFGFLWWNTSPAQIFMGDTGSLALGGAIAAMAIFSKTELLLPLMAGLFVIIAVSVIAQVISFKMTGKRIIKMAPLHHHFEIVGWGEVTIVVRFWIIQGISIAVGLCLFYAEWVRA